MVENGALLFETLIGAEIVSMTPAGRRARYDVGIPFDYGQRVGNRNRAAARAQKSVVVFRVADPDDVERRQP